MQIRCSHCHRPFALGRDAVHAALDGLQAEDLSHFNTYCPHCGRSNRVSRQELQRSAPDWEPGAAESPTETTTSPGSSES